MKFLKINKDISVSLLLTLVYLIINLLTLSDYGVTWDFTYHFNVGLWHLQLPLQDKSVVIGPSPPLSDVLPALSYLLFFEKLHLLPWDASYNLYGVIIGSAAIGILYLFVCQLYKPSIAFISSLILAFLPRYFGHLHNNMKDIPQSVFFMLSLFLFWRLIRIPTFKNLLLASIAFAVSYNSKVNAIFILVIAASFLLTQLFIFKQKIGNKVIFLYFFLAPLAALLLWWPFWTDPVGRLLEARHSYTTSTTNMPVLYFGRLYYSGVTIPLSYPFGLLAVTTPSLILFFFCLGVVKLIKDTIRKKSYALFILFWFFVPLLRYFKPNMIIIDDIRHFMEVLFPLAIISGTGAYQLYLFIHARIPKIRVLQVTIPIHCILLGIVSFYLLIPISLYHPFQTSYFNELIGGVKGAQGKFDIEFWASSYKYALSYLNQNAPQNAKIVVSMAPDIAKLYLRDDLQSKLNLHNLASVDPTVYKESDYTVILNRQSFWEWFSIPPYMKDRKPLYTLAIQSVPLVYIYKN